MNPKHGEPDHFCSGGCAGYAGGGTVTADKPDPSEIPEDIKEYVKKAHKEQIESRPDESWRITPPKKPDSIAPYKRDDEDIEAAKEEELPHFDEGGEVGADQPVDPNQDLKDMAPAGSGLLSPAPFAPIQPANPAPIDNAPPPPPAPIAPAPQNVQRGTIPATEPTDQDFMLKANKLLGLDPGQQAAFMKLLGDRSQKGQIGAGIAGIGDAIASGGTLGKVNPGNLQRSEDLIQNKQKEGIEGAQLLRGNQKDNFELGQTLRGNSPYSPALQKALVTQFHVPAALAGAPRDVINKMLDPIAQTQLKEAEIAETEAYRGSTIDLQKSQLAATVANQKAQQENAERERKQEAAKALLSRGPLDKAAAILSNTATGKATKTLSDEMKTYPPDVTAFAEKHGITPEQAQAVKAKRTEGQ